MDTTLVQDGEFREALKKMISSISRDACLQEDLLQEALVHLWKIEKLKPNRTQSWYIQSCWFHLQHWLAAGKSVDSLKRCRGESRLTADETNLPDYHTNGENFERVSFQDLVITLERFLHPGELAVLRGLASGLDLREVCRSAGLSYPTALKYRRRIACLVCKLESCPNRLAQAVTSKPRFKPENNQAKVRVKIVPRFTGSARLLRTQTTTASDSQPLNGEASIPPQTSVLWLRSRSKPKGTDSSATGGNVK